MLEGDWFWVFIIAIAVLVFVWHLKDEGDI
jgi:hypothetical protein